MAGGQQTTISRALIGAIAALIIAIGSPTPGGAADLAGDCCADLEERVAELEATTVRNANRKVSVKLSGHVSKMLLFWDDGINDDVYVVDNSDSESSFKLSGSAHVSPSITAGFKIEVDLQSADSFSVNDRIDGAPNENIDGFTVLDVASFHINHKRLGKITIGRDSPSTNDILTLDLSSNPLAGPDTAWADSFHLVRPHGTSGCSGAACRTTLNLDAVSPERDTSNGDIIRYDSPSLRGFIISTSFGEDDLVDLTLRYKVAWKSFRFVAGIGYLWFTDETESLTSLSGTAVIPCPAPGLGQLTCVDQRQDFEALAGSTSLMHMPTGLYVNFSAVHESFNRNNGQPPLRASTFTAPVTGRGAEDADLWYVQGGLKRRLLAPAIGDTTLYGEYQQWNDFGVRRDAANVTGLTAGTSEITDTSAGMWGLGIVQDIDDAALKLYGGLRVFEHELRAATAATAPEGEDIPLKNFYAVAAGGKINF